ncbi:hypothetical protein EV361DRAFT_902551 [Lentinula raphanica]|nr:hypothetical protein EV361DRAFT_902551 [Lentinula raphanica]
MYSVIFLCLCVARLGVGAPIPVFEGFGQFEPSNGLVSAIFHPSSDESTYFSPESDIEFKSFPGPRENDFLDTDDGYNPQTVVSSTNLEQVLTLAEAEAKFGFQWDLSVWNEDNEAGSDEELYLGLENVNEEEGAEEDLIRIGDDRWVEDIDEGRYIDDDQAWEDNVDFDCEDEEGSTTEAEDDDQVWNSITDYIDTSSMDGEDSTDLPWNNLPNFDSRSPDEHIVHVLERDKAGSLVTELSRIHRKRQVMNPYVPPYKVV